MVRWYSKDGGHTRRDYINLERSARRFTDERMARDHLRVYGRLAKSADPEFDRTL